MESCDQYKMAAPMAEVRSNMTVVFGLFLLVLSLSAGSLQYKVNSRSDVINDVQSGRTQEKVAQRSLHFTARLEQERMDGQTMYRRKQVADVNLSARRNTQRLNENQSYRHRSDKLTGRQAQLYHYQDLAESGNVAAGIYNPGDAAPSFTLNTLNGQLKYPGPVLTSKTAILLHAYTPHSAFLRCVWNCSGSVEALIQHSPNTTHYIFFSHGDNAYSNSLWMRSRFNTAVHNILITKTRSKSEVESMLQRVHFVTTPLYELGNWIPSVFKQWTCSDHNCGLDQALFTTSGQSTLVLPRLDARYDWLPGYPMGKTFNVTDAGDGCQTSSVTKGTVAIVTDTGCSYFTKVEKMSSSGALGVIIIPTSDVTPQDINCNQSECSTPLNTPLTMTTVLHKGYSRSSLKTVTFQNTPYDNFFFGVDATGRLAEVGWSLYPSFHYLAWQAQWFEYKRRLQAELSEDALVITILNNTSMQGNAGAAANVTLPPLKKMLSYSKVQLDMSLSCPGDRDTTCPHWDHTVQLYVCCNPASPRCGTELGRWISPFRRRIGRWLTDVTALLLLLDGPRCTFTMKTVPWAMMWKPSLNLRFTGTRKLDSPVAALVSPMYSPGATFDSHYNSHFPLLQFKLPSKARKVEIVSVITGHGSDENGCGEFCVTSHHFVINNVITFNRTFDIAGTPLGCADNVPNGVEPNEHGTWLYGRDGWCDGQQVSPWVIDITKYLNQSDYNTIQYFGWFQGKDPNPKSNPGVMILYAYLVEYQ